MSTTPLYQIDAFASAVFEGNPAAVCPLPAWLPDETLQAIAAENNLSETAFFVWPEAPAPLRWFTPREEVPLCGHATMAAAFVVLEYLAPRQEAVTFSSQSGDLTVMRTSEGFALDFPALAYDPLDAVPEALTQGLDADVVDVLVCESDPNYFVILGSQKEVLAFRPDLRLIETLHPYGVAVSAPGDESDIVARYFAPSYGIPEDPVTGSIHCALAPYWANRLGKAALSSIQLSERRGRLDLRIEGRRVRLGGRAVCFLKGEILLP